jgi:hypothetical protein
VDPLSILFAANACVSAIKQGCKLYKDAKTSFMEIKKTVDEVASDVKAGSAGFWAKLVRDRRPSQQRPKSVAKKKEKPTLPLTKPKSWQTLSAQLVSILSNYKNSLLNT